MPLPESYFAGKNREPLELTPASGRFRDKNGVAYQCRPTQIIKQSFTNPSTIVTNGISTSHAGAGAAGTTSMTIGGSLASDGVATLTPARNVVITVTHGSAVVAMSGTITGTRLGKTVTEAWSVTAGTTSKTFTGAVAFDTVTSITETVAADASANTIIAGNGKKLGLNFVCSYPARIAETEDGAVPTAGTVVAGSTSANADERGTYAPNSTLNGALDFVIWYLSDDVNLFQS